MKYKMFLVLAFLFILFYSVKSVWYLFRTKKGSMWDDWHVQTVRV